MKLERTFLEHGHSFDFDNMSLESCSNGGLFSNFYHTLWSIIDLHNQGITARAISFKGGNKMFRDESIEDLYPSLFETDDQNLALWESRQGSIGTLPRLDHHGVYSLYPYQKLALIMDAYFQPSSEVKTIVDSWRSKHKLNDSPYAALYYRGTDKHTEVTLPEVDAMIEKTKQQMSARKITRCLVQTDDARVLDAGLTELSGAFYLEELPVTNGDEGFHYQNATDEVIPPLLFAQRLLAMTYILANAATLTLPVSNLAGWVCLIRGHTDKVSQYNKHGRHINAAYVNSFIVKNCLRRLFAKLKNQPYYYV